MSKKYCYQTRREQWDAWTNKGSHLTIFLTIALVFELVALFKQTVHVTFTFPKVPAVFAQVPLVSPLPSYISLDVLLPSTKVEFSTPQPTPVVQTKSWQEIKEAIKKLAPIYDFPVNLALAQAAHESARGTSQLAREKNNLFGLNAVDWDPFQSAWSFDNPEQCIIEYMRLIKRSYPDAYGARKNPALMLQLIKSGGYASDPNYVSKVMAMPEWSEQ